MLDSSKQFHLVVGHHATDEPVRLRLFGGDLRARQNHLHGLRLADGANQALCASAAFSNQGKNVFGALISRTNLE